METQTATRRQAHPASESGPRIVSLGTALPRHRWTQDEIRERLAEHFPLYADRRVRRIFEASGIETRNLVLGSEDFDPRADADGLHALYREHAVPLAERAARSALEQAGLEATDVECLVVATCTGYLCPGLTARLGARLGMRDDLQRADLVGMGCAAAMPALQRGHDFVRARPDARALVVCVEVSSACWFVDASLETVVGNTICADGAAAVVLGTEGPGPVLERFGTLLEPSFLESVGLEFEAGRHRIVLSKDLRTAAGPLVGRAVDRLLESSGVEQDQVDRWIVHSGGRRVLDGIDRALELAPDGLANSREVLRSCGNMSSPTLLFVMERTLREARSGDVGVMIALGPGLAAETALVRW